MRCEEGIVRCKLPSAACGEYLVTSCSGRNYGKDRSSSEKWIADPKLVVVVTRLFVHVRFSRSDCPADLREDLSGHPRSVVLGERSTQVPRLSDQPPSGMEHERTTRTYSAVAPMAYQWPGG